MEAHLTTHGRQAQRRHVTKAVRTRSEVHTLGIELNWIELDSVDEPHTGPAGGGHKTLRQS